MARARSRGRALLPKALAEARRGGGEVNREGVNRGGESRCVGMKGG